MQMLRLGLSPRVPWTIDVVHRTDRHGALVMEWPLDPTAQLERIEMDSERAGHLPEAEVGPVCAMTAISMFAGRPSIRELGSFLLCVVLTLLTQVCGSVEVLGGGSIEAGMTWQSIPMFQAVPSGGACDKPRGLPC
jgi:hypothetical protein